MGRTQISSSTYYLLCFCDSVWGEHRDDLKRWGSRLISRMVKDGLIERIGGGKLHRTTQAGRQKISEYDDWMDAKFAPSVSTPRVETNGVQADICNEREQGQE